MANKYFQSWLATAIGFLAFDGQDVIISIANGNWGWPVWQTLGFVALRSLIKALIVFIFPQLPINKPAEITNPNQ